MKKDVKVIEIKSIAANGNDRTVYAIGTLDLSVADICQGENIPMLSIISTRESLPMTQAEAMEYAFYQHTALVHDANVSYAKTKIRFCIA